MPRDQEYMALALNEARKAMRSGNLPIGALLLVDNEVVGTRGNSQVDDSNYFSHAEHMLIGENASRIKEASGRKQRIELFTTLEPCLMCLGTSVHNRISRIVFACEDPIAGSTAIQPPTDWYKRKWPEIVGGVCRIASYELFTGYLREHLDTWENALKQFEEMRKAKGF